MSLATATVESTATSPHVAGDSSVDVLFDAAATLLPRDHRAALRDAIAACAPALAGDTTIGIHPLKTTVIDDTTTLLSRRARLALRVAASRVEAALELRAHVLDVGGHPIRLGNARVRALVPSATIFAAFVATMAADELAHQRAVERMLERIAIPPRFICGRLLQLRCGDAELVGASVLLHELTPADSLRVQRIGLGAHRTLGCGLFIPYKAIGALD